MNSLKSRFDFCNILAASSAYAGELSAGGSASLIHMSGHNLRR